jgi:hypothetical protein
VYSLLVATAIGVVPLKEGILRAFLACQAQNRTAISSKGEDGGNTLRVTGTATTTRPGR